MILHKLAPYGDRRIDGVHFPRVPVGHLGLLKFGRLRGRKIGFRLW